MTDLQIIAQVRALIGMPPEASDSKLAAFVEAWGYRREGDGIIRAREIMREVMT